MGSGGATMHTNNIYILGSIKLAAVAPLNTIVENHAPLMIITVIPIATKTAMAFGCCTWIGHLIRQIMGVAP